MFYVRSVKTASASTAVQVVKYAGKRTIVVKHIGSGKTKEEIFLLKKEASDWIKEALHLQTLFPEDCKKSSSFVIQLNKSKFLGVRHYFAQEIITVVLGRFGLAKLDKLLLDLVLIRIVEPASKLHSLDLLSQYFSINYSASDIYRGMAGFLKVKEDVESLLVAFAKKELNFDFHLVLYDVTTLYFETFHGDSLRKCGYSKDNKFNQPQIMIGLVVNRNGFPISYEVFEGNTFEGHTLLPSILAYKNKYHIKELTVVADAAMISKENIARLLSCQLSYIVGARLGNLKHDLIAEISRKLNRGNRRSARFSTAKGELICDFSSQRYLKDKKDMDKQIVKAQTILSNPSLLKKNKYLKSSSKTNLVLNQSLIDKALLLLGIKGYYTNLHKSKAFIIKRYHDLWQIEKSFRISKSDLEMRPIYHFKSETIKSHILICFVALGILKYLEIKTGKSPQKIIELLMSIADGRILDTVSNQEFLMRMELTAEVKSLVDKIDLPY